MCGRGAGRFRADSHPGRESPTPPETLPVLPQPAHARQVVLELGQLDLAGCPRSCARAARRCRGSVACGRRRASSARLRGSSVASGSVRRRRVGLRLPPPERLLQLRQLSLSPRRERAKEYGARDIGTPLRSARRPRCARAPQARRAHRPRRCPSGRRREGARAPAPPRVRDRAGAQSLRDYAAVRSAGDRACRPPRCADARARGHPLRRAAGRTRYASMCSRARCPRAG